MHPKKVLQNLTIFAAFALLVWNPSCRSKDKFSPPTRPRIWVIGLDGASWRFIDILIDQGKLPNFARLKKESAWGVLHTIQPTISPVVWTTMATGLRVEKHRILGWEKGSELITSNWRQGVPFWEIADRRKYRAAVINWWATYPVTVLQHGWMISDRFRNGIHPDFDIHAPGLVSPESLTKKYAPLFPFVSPKVTEETLLRLRFPMYSQVRHDHPEILNRNHGLERLRAIPSYIRQDIIVRTIVEDILQKDKPDLLVTLFRTADVYSHMVLTVSPDVDDFVQAKEELTIEVLVKRGNDPDVAHRIEELDKRFANLIEPALLFLDETLGRLYPLMPNKNMYLIVASDHGFLWRGERLYDHEALPGLPLADGILAVHGPGVRKGFINHPISVYDIAPLVIGLIGAPLSRELHSGFPNYLFENPQLFEHTIQTVKSYKRIHSDVKVSSDELHKTESPTREDLKTLGYIQ